MSADDPGSRGWQPTADEMMASIARVSAERRADCPAFVAEFAEVYAADLTPGELDQKWVEIVRTAPWYAEDLLHCVEETVKDAEHPVPDIVCDIAQVEADGGEVERQISDEQWRALGRHWLKHLLQRFRPVFEDLSAS